MATLYGVIQDFRSHLDKEVTELQRKSFTRFFRDIFDFSGKRKEAREKTIKNIQAFNATFNEIALQTQVMDPADGHGLDCRGFFENIPGSIKDLDPNRLKIFLRSQIRSLNDFLVTQPNLLILTVKDYDKLGDVSVDDLNRALIELPADASLEQLLGAFKLRLALVARPGNAEAIRQADEREQLWRAEQQARPLEARQVPHPLSPEERMQLANMEAVSSGKSGKIAERFAEIIVGIRMPGDESRIRNIESSMLPKEEEKRRIGILQRGKFGIKRLFWPWSEWWTRRAILNYIKAKLRENGEPREALAIITSSKGAKMRSCTADLLLRKEKSDLERFNDAEKTKKAMQLERRIHYHAALRALLDEVPGAEFPNSFLFKGSRLLIPGRYDFQGIFPAQKLLCLVWQAAAADRPEGVNLEDAREAILDGIVEIHTAHSPEIFTSVFYSKDVPSCPPGTAGRLLEAAQFVSKKLRPHFSFASAVEQSKTTIINRARFFIKTQLQHLAPEQLSRIAEYFEKTYTLGILEKKEQEGKKEEEFKEIPGAREFAAFSQSVIGAVPKFFDTEFPRLVDELLDNIDKQAGKKSAQEMREMHEAIQSKKEALKELFKNILTSELDSVGMKQGAQPPEVSYMQELIGIATAGDYQAIARSVWHTSLSTPLQEMVYHTDCIGYQMGDVGAFLRVAMDLVPGLAEFHNTKRQEEWLQRWEKQRELYENAVKELVKWTEAAHRGKMPTPVAGQNFIFDGAKIQAAAIAAVAKKIHETEGQALPDAEREAATIVSATFKDSTFPDDLSSSCGGRLYKSLQKEQQFLQFSAKAKKLELGLDQKSLVQLAQATVTLAFDIEDLKQLHSIEEEDNPATMYLKYIINHFAKLLLTPSSDDAKKLAAKSFFANLQSPTHWENLAKEGALHATIEKAQLYVSTLLKDSGLTEIDLRSAVSTAPTSTTQVISSLPPKEQKEKETTPKPAATVLKPSVPTSTSGAAATPPTTPKPAVPRPFAPAAMSGIKHHQ